MRFDVAARRLREQLGRDLPGGRGQKRLAPRPRIGWEPDQIPGDATAAAALLLLYPDDAGRALVLLTVRDRGLPKHAGQVSLPGGRVEAGETAVEAALREAREEVGLGEEGIEILGPLSRLHIPVTRFALEPIVALRQAAPDLVADPREVARILAVPLEHLTQPQRVDLERRERDGITYEIPIVRIEGERLWGATAMVLAELLTLLGHDPSPWPDEHR